MMGGGDSGGGVSPAAAEKFRLSIGQRSYPKAGVAASIEASMFLILKIALTPF
jgi:hypothetical protein